MDAKARSVRLGRSKRSWGLWVDSSYLINAVSLPPSCLLLLRPLATSTATAPGMQLPHVEGKPTLITGPKTQGGGDDHIWLVRVARIEDR